MAKKPAIIEEAVLAEGIRLSRSFFDRRENRVLTLLLKGFIVYLYTMGGIGFYLSAFHIEYNKPLVHIVIFMMAIACALLYYRLLAENLGYLALLAGFGFLVYMFRDYINSGFYAVVNITVDDAAQYFSIDIQRLYNERIGNRYVTVTMAALFIGIVLDILLNVYISRRMQYVNALITVIPVNLIPLYMTEEPHPVYALMIVAATAISMIYKSSRHYSPLVQIKRTNAVFEQKKKKKRPELSYVYDVKGLGQAGILALAFSLVVVLAVSVLKPVENFNVGYKTNKYKEVTMAAMGTLLVDGFEGFWRRGMRGGVSTGELGNVSSITLDHQTDLIVEYTPYTAETLYLKGFTAVDYIPYINRWEGEPAYTDPEYHPEADALAEAYTAGEKYSARGVLRVNNIDGDRRLSYRPYYARESETPSRFERVTYYPRLTGNETPVQADDYPEGVPFTDADLTVPQENMDTVARVCRELSLEGMSQDEIVRTVTDYFQNEIPYTVKPGRTPRDADFVNYFLNDGKKGYCVHFASAATLIFRYMGIPARFVEGYAIGIEQVYSEGEILEDQEYGDYYKGYSSLGETAVVHVEATDADAHAWVEIYDEKLGWHPVEVTPSSSEEEDTTSFWDEFDRIMGDGDEDNTEDGTGVGAGISNAAVRRAFLLIFAAVGAAIGVALLLWLGKYALYWIRFARADINDKLILWYTRLRKRRSKKDKAFRECLNYRSQLSYLVGLGENPGEDVEWLIDTLEHAGFSRELIDEDAYKNAVAACKRLFKNRVKGK